MPMWSEALREDGFVHEERGHPGPGPAETVREESPGAAFSRAVDVHGIPLALAADDGERVAELDGGAALLERDGKHLA